MKLSDILRKDANNLDIFRVIAACMVIYGHAYALCPEPGKSDITTRLLGYDHSGALAVKIFFFLSGLVVTNSLLQKRDPLQFAIARFFRICAGAYFYGYVLGLALGPVLTSLSFHEYFSNINTYKYIHQNITMHINYLLPGVFSENPYKDAINGSLWTIPYEIGAYITLLALFMIGLFRSKILPCLIFLGFLIDPLTGNKLFLTWMPQNGEVNILAPCFAFGALMATYKEKIIIDLHTFIGVWILFFIFKTSAYTFYFMYFATFISIIYLASRPFILKIKPKSDISYGIYLWGFPVQQTMAHFFSEYGVRFNQISSLTICLVLGFLSWHLIEKRAMTIGAGLTNKIKPQRALTITD